MYLERREADHLDVVETKAWSAEGLDSHRQECAMPAVSTRVALYIIIMCDLVVGLSLRSCIYTGTHQLFPTRVLAQLSRL